MSTAAPARSFFSPFLSFTQTVKAFQLDDLVGERRLGVSLSFAELRPSFELLFELVKRIEDTNFYGTPVRTINSLNQVFAKLTGCISAIRNLDSATADANRQRNALMQDFGELLAESLERVSPIINLYAERSSDAGVMKAKAENLLSEIEANAAKQWDVLQKAKSLLESQRSLSEQTGVAHYSKLFEDEAESHLDASRNWLIATSVCAVLAVVLTYFNYRDAIDAIGKFVASVQRSGETKPIGAELNIPGALIVQLALAKLMFFSLVLTGVLWMARIYKSHRHNFVVNRHRANALRSFETFVKSSADVDTKSAVLLQTTTCIYSPQSTGYTTGDNDPESPLKVLEVVRSLQTKP